jgi:hypothetical protein
MTRPPRHGAGLSVLLFGLLATVLAPSACGSHEAANPTSEAGVDAGPATLEAAASPPPEGGGGEADTATDGPPNRTAACTPLSQQVGTALDTNFGRLDGTLAYVVPINGNRGCNGDGSHVHLQVRVQSAIYDVAVDIGTFTGDVNLYEEDILLPGGPWAEGWHGTDSLTYTALGVHAPEFTPENPSALSAQLVSELAQVNHISIFGTSYNTANGCHDVHFHGGGTDGAMFLDPLSPKAHALLFRFQTDNF